MTHPILGRAVPIHFAMVNLAAWGLNPGVELYSDKDKDWGFQSGASALELMLQGRVELMIISARDFEFSLERWHQHLFKAATTPGTEDFGYGHPYAAQTIDQIVRQALLREDRKALEAIAREAWDEHVESLSLELQEILTRPP